MQAHNPIGFTGYEIREHMEEDHVWVENGNLLVFEMPLDDHGDWIVTARYTVDSEGVRLNGLDISPGHLYPTPPPLSTSVVRMIRLSVLERRAKDWLAIRREVGLAIETDESEFLQNRRPGKVGRSDAFYARIAYRYLELVRAGSSPTKALAAERHISQSSARDLVHEARVRGLMTSMGRGQAGGQLTAKARKLLEEGLENH
ncbi:MAG: hypothetical protein ABSC90_12005 [Acidimicrobiales bacterium]|jgi:hypothetical protein